MTRLELQNQFLGLRDRLRKTSIFVTHDVREALRLGTRIALLHRGRLEFLATPARFLNSDGAGSARVSWSTLPNATAMIALTAAGDLLDLTGEHLVLVLVSMVIAVAIGHSARAFC